MTEMSFSDYSRKKLLFRPLDILKWFGEGYLCEKISLQCQKIERFHLKSIKQKPTCIS